MREFLEELIRASLLDYGRLWPLVNATLEAIAGERTRVMDHALKELELLECLAQWRARYENNQRLSRRLKEVTRMIQQMREDEERLFCSNRE
jgi:hypothetical protein